jgi:hypothetical protein
MRAALYLRVSTKSDKRDDDAAREEVLRAKIKAQGVVFAYELIRRLLQLNRS